MAASASQQRQWVATRPASPAAGRNGAAPVLRALGLMLRLYVAAALGLALAAAALVGAVFVALEWLYRGVHGLMPSGSAPGAPARQGPARRRHQ